MEERPEAAAAPENLLGTQILDPTPQRLDRNSQDGTRQWIQRAFQLIPTTASLRASARGTSPDSIPMRRLISELGPSPPLLPGCFGFSEECSIFPGKPETASGPRRTSLLHELTWVYLVFLTCKALETQDGLHLWSLTTRVRSSPRWPWALSMCPPVLERAAQQREINTSKFPSPCPVCCSSVTLSFNGRLCFLLVPGRG